MENQGQRNGYKRNEGGHKNNPNQFKSITDWWQQYSRQGWYEMYAEYINYTTSMTEIYKEYVKSSERMTKYWSTRFPKPSYSEEQRREKQTSKLKDKNQQ